MTTMPGKCGLFSLESGGHDRHICLRNGNVYVRIWNTEDGDNWQDAGQKISSGKKYNDGKWHNIQLQCQDGVGANVYVDKELIGKLDRDHSDFDWKEHLCLGYSADMKVKFSGQIRNVAYGPLGVEKMKFNLNIAKKLTEEATTQADNANSGISLASPAVIETEESPIMIAEAPTDFKLKKEKIQPKPVKSKRKPSPEMTNLEIIKQIEEEDSPSQNDSGY